jgi:hypothetical protein
MTQPTCSAIQMSSFFIRTHREQKIQILKNWQLEASRLEGSEGEGMRGEDAPSLHRVSKALAALLGQR